ncbi:hypothetical protein Lal_00030379 [Lupinus albus]|nr:hypothetical protein Lal_00030379 [Lupinus albus]
MEVQWWPPISGWVKVNIDSATHGASGHIGCLAILAIEIAHKRGWKKLWLECDSLLVVNCFNFQVP